MGVDSSTQSCKVVIVDTSTGHLVRSGRASHPDGTEVDPSTWWEALQAAIADAGGMDDVEAWSIAGQQHGMVALDAQGRIIRPALLWNDTRSADAAADLIDEVGAMRFAERTGVVPVASFTAAKLRWLADHEPGDAGRVAAVALPHDWLTWRLRGFGPENPALEELITDRSDASGTAYWGEGGYDLDILSQALRREAAAVALPRVLSPDEYVTDADGRRVAPGAGDNAGAALGVGAHSGDAVVSIGTSGTVFAVTDRPVRDATGTVAGFADAAGGWLPLIATLNAARVLDAAADLLGVGHDELSALALTASPGAGGLVMQPWFEGERTPNRPDATATLFGMTLASTTRANLARAAIEGVLCGLAEGLAAIRAQGVETHRILLIGGGSQSAAVRTIAAQVFDLPVVVPEPREYVAQGAAVQAAWVLSGSRPGWETGSTAPTGGESNPVILEQYRRRLP